MATQEIILTSLYIELKRDKNGKTYFSIHDKDTGKTYLVFPNRTKGWHDLVTKWAKAKAIQLQFRSDKRKVIALKILKLYPRFPKQLLA